LVSVYQATCRLFKRFQWESCGCYSESVQKKTDRTWRMFGYLCSGPLRSPRFSLADFYFSKRHLRSRPITFESGVLTVS